MARMKRLITFELSEEESAMLDMMLHELRQNDPCASLDHSRQAHDIVRSVLFDDYLLHAERIAEGARQVH